MSHGVPITTFVIFLLLFWIKFFYLKDSIGSPMQRKEVLLLFTQSFIGKSHTPIRKFKFMVEIVTDDGGIH